MLMFKIVFGWRDFFLSDGMWEIDVMVIVFICILYLFFFRLWFKLINFEDRWVFCIKE